MSAWPSFGDPSPKARFDVTAGRWQIAAGTYKFAVGSSANDLKLTGETRLSEAQFGS